VEYEAENENNDHASNAEMNAAKLHSAARAALVAPVFDIIATATWIPAHERSPSSGFELQASSLH
jgi:hypothetical protein